MERTSEEISKENGTIFTRHKGIFHQGARCSHYFINFYKIPEWEEATIEVWYSLSPSLCLHFRN